VLVFVALNIPEDVRAAIGALIAKMRPACQNILAGSKRSPRPVARWARIESAHITLKFIGEVPSETIDPIKAALARIRLPDPVEMKFRNVGFFPNERRPRVFWAGIEAGAELGALAAAVETFLEPLGIARERRAFSPHLTLARFESPRGTRADSTLALKASSEAWSPPEYTGAGSTWSPPEYLNSLREAISGAGPLEFGGTTAKEFHLYQSILKPSGAEYTRLATYRFAEGEPL
jgi:2'-5' RNA ligase